MKEKVDSTIKPHAKAKAWFQEETSLVDIFDFNLIS